MRILSVNQNQNYNYQTQKQNVNFSAVVAKPEHFKVFDGLVFRSFYEKIVHGFRSRHLPNELKELINETRGLSKTNDPYKIPDIRESGEPAYRKKELYLSQKEDTELNAAIKAATNEIHKTTFAPSNLDGEYLKKEERDITQELLENPSSSLKALKDLAEKLVKQAKPAEEILTSFETRFATAELKYQTALVEAEKARNNELYDISTGLNALI